jgi:splicing factor 3B subunit 2
LCCYASEEVKEEEGGAKKEGDGEEADDKGDGAESSDDEDGEGGEAGLSKKAAKLLSRMKVAELKQHCTKPEVGGCYSC